MGREYGAKYEAYYYYLELSTVPCKTPTPSGRCPRTALGTCPRSPPRTTAVPRTGSATSLYLISGLKAQIGKAQRNGVTRPRDVNPPGQRGETSWSSIPRPRRRAAPLRLGGTDGETTAGESRCSNGFSSRKTSWAKHPGL